MSQRRGWSIFGLGVAAGVLTMLGIAAYNEWRANGGRLW